MTTQSLTSVVTGAGSGIGFAVASAMVQEGFRVLINGRNEEKLASAAQQLGWPGHVATLAGDVTEPATAERIVKAAVEKFGRLDVLVNNAGIFSHAALYRVHVGRARQISRLSARDLPALASGGAADAPPGWKAVPSSTLARFWRPMGYTVCRPALRLRPKGASWR